MDYAKKLQSIWRPERNTQSNIPKKVAASALITKTMPVVSNTSRRVGQVTLETSERTCWINWKGFVVAICILSVNYSAHLSLWAADFKSTYSAHRYPTKFFYHFEPHIRASLIIKIYQLRTNTTRSIRDQNWYSRILWKIQPTLGMQIFRSIRLKL